MQLLLALLILTTAARSDDPEPSPAPGEPEASALETPQEPMLEAGVLSGFGGLIGAQGVQIEAPPYDGPRLTVGVPEVRGSLTVQQVRAVTLMHAKAVRYCYQRRVAEGLDEQGALTVRFAIEPDGAVSKVKVRGEGVRDEQVLGCVRVRFERILFSEAADGRETRVTVPLTLELP